MSHSDNNEQSSQSLVDISQTAETKSPSSMTKESSDSKDVLKSSIQLSGPSTGPGSVEDTLLACETLDPKDHVILVEQPHSRAEANSLVFSRDILESSCQISDVETASSHYSSSDWSNYSEPFRGILESYTHMLRRFRRNGYLIPFELICLAFTIACCYMGAYNWPLCPADKYIPRYVFFSGGIATFSVCLKIVNSLWLLVLGWDSIMLRKCYCAVFFGWVAAIMTLVEMVEFYTMSYSFHRMERNYCSEAFYWFVHYKNIAVGVVMTLTAAFYLPGYKSYPRSFFSL